MTVTEYKAIWKNGESSYTEKHYYNCAETFSGSGTGVATPGGFQVRSFTRDFVSQDALGRPVEGTHTLHIDSGANLYAHPASIGTRFEVVGAGMTELTFDPQDASAIEPTIGSVVPGKEIEFGGKHLNADSQRFFEVAASTTTLGKPSRMFGPVVVNFDWWASRNGKAEVPLYLSYHPNFGVLGASAYHESLQGAVDIASQMLEEDNDPDPIAGRIEDFDPRVWPGHPEFEEQTYLHDDVPAYVQFKVRLGCHPRFPCISATAECAWNPNFAIVGFYNVPDQQHRDQLLAAQFANVKIVNNLYSYEENGQTVSPAAWGAPGPTYLVKAAHVGDSQLFAHEFGHAQLLAHREDGIAPIPPNPGADVNAIMHKSLEGGREINRNERGAYNYPSGQGWNYCNP